MYHQLRRIDANRTEAMEGLLMLFYDRVSNGFSRTYLTGIFIDLEGDSKGGGG